MGVVQYIVARWDVGLKNDWLAHVDVFKPYNQCFRVTWPDQIVVHFHDHIWVLIGIELSEVKIDAILFQKGNMIHDVLRFVGVVCHGEGHQEGRCPILIGWTLRACLIVCVSVFCLKGLMHDE